MADGYPTVPADRLDDDGWTRRARTEETLFRTPTAKVVGRTLVYDDAALRDALAAAGASAFLTAGSGADAGNRLVDTGEDGDYWRFFFATSLTFRPPLAPGIGPASMLPTVRREARSAFTDDLEARGFVDVDTGRGQRVRTDAGDRARLKKVTARLPLGPDAPAEALDVEGWLAVWTTGGQFRIAGGAYPVRGLDALLASLPEDDRPSIDPTTYRDELLALVRAVR